jgi:hypothetical protein
MLHEKHNQKAKFLVLMCLSVAIVARLSSDTIKSSYDWQIIRKPNCHQFNEDPKIKAKAQEGDK